MERTYMNKAHQKWLRKATTEPEKLKHIARKTQLFLSWDTIL